MININFFDCFAGIGGFYQGALQIHSDAYQFQHVAFCEIDNAAQKLYKEVCVANGVQFIPDIKDIKTKKKLLA
jgi:DNA (cytosine-5)-methyltransferase 1